MSCALLADRGPQILFSDDFIWIVYSLNLSIFSSAWDAIISSLTQSIKRAVKIGVCASFSSHTVPCTPPLVVGGGSVAVLSVSSAFRKFPSSLCLLCRCGCLHLSADRHIWNIPLPFCSLVVKCIVRNTTAELHVLLWCRFSLNFFGGDQNTKTRFKVRTLASLSELQENSKVNELQIASNSRKTRRAALWVVIVLLCGLHIKQHKEKWL